MHSKIISIIIIFLIVTIAALSIPVTSSANTGYGGGNEKVTVCKKTGSRFIPFVKVTVPKKVADQFIKDGGAYPDRNGNCPKSKSIGIREYFSRLLHNMFDHTAYGKNNNSDKNHK